LLGAPARVGLQCRWINRRIGAGEGKVRDAAKGAFQKSHLGGDVGIYAGVHFGQFDFFNFLLKSEDSGGGVREVGRFAVTLRETWGCERQQQYPCIAIHRRIIVGWRMRAKCGFYSARKRCA